MASLATIFNRFVGIEELAGTRVETKTDTWTRTGAQHLRPFANEDVYLFVKRIDNSTVVRAIDVPARHARTGSVAAAFAAAVLAIAGLAPAAYNTMAGFTTQNLEQEHQRLVREKARLDREQADLLSTRRLEQLAKSLRMEAPGPQAIRYVDANNTPAEAQNVMPGTNGGSAAR